MLGLHFKNDVALSDLLQIGVLIVTAIAFLIRLHSSNRSRVESDEKASKERRIQIYQTLEMESSSVFRFQSEHKYIIPYYTSNLCARDLKKKRIHDNDGTLVSSGEMDLIARKYYEISCNLFEVSARLRILLMSDEVVFGSWVAWYFDALVEWGFRAAWEDLRDNYTTDLRDIFDPFVAELIEDWDIPHNQGVFDRYEAPNGDETGWSVEASEVEKLRDRFYDHVATVVGERRPDGSIQQCEVVRDWLKNAKAGAPPKAHPMAFS